MAWMSRKSTSRKGILMKPEWEDRCKFAKIASPSLLRPLPSLDANGNPEPWRIGKGQRDIGNWIEVLPAGNFWGSATKISMIDVQPDQASQWPTGVLRKCEIRLFENVKTKKFPEFIEMMTGTTKDSKFTRVNDCAFVQALLYHHDGSDIMPPEFCVFVLRGSAVQYLECLLNLPLGGADAAAPTDLINGYACGNVTGLDTGKLWLVHGKEKELNEVEKMMAKLNGNKVADPIKLFVIDQTDVNPVDLGTVRKYVKPWNEIIHMPTRAEAWSMVSMALGKEATAFCGHDEIDNLPVDCRDRAHQYHISIVGGRPVSVPASPAETAGTSPQQPQRVTAPVAPPKVEAPAPAAGFTPGLGGYTPPAMDSTLSKEQAELQRLLGSKVRPATSL